MYEDSLVTSSSDLQLSDTVRRYLDLPKYLDLLRSQSLYLRRADRFTDRFEGALTPLFRKMVDEAYRKGKIAYDANDFYLRARGGNYVSCWSLGAEDNMALWQLYGGASCSVAITSTIDKLVLAAHRWREKVFIWKVQYIDHFENPDMVIDRYRNFLQFKHLAYKYEDEVRIVVPRDHDNWKENLEGIRLPLGNLNDLIQSVVVAPEAKPWFYELIEDATRRYRVNSPVLRSRLTHLP